MAKKWKYSAGTYGNKVTVMERVPGGTLYVRFWDSTKRNGKGDYVLRSLGHKDREKAKRQAHRSSERLATQSEPGSLPSIVSKYAASSGKFQNRASMLASYFGEASPSLAKWDQFIRDRLDGTITGRPVRARTVQAELQWLSAAYNWAVRHGLIKENPVRFYPIPREKNPLRPVMTEGEFEALLVVSEPPLSFLLVLAYYTGRRLSALLNLRAEDYVPTYGPHGSLRWRAETDKTGRLSVIPIPMELKWVLKQLPQDGFLFPAPRDRTKPMSRHYADKLLRKAYGKAGIRKRPGGLWHPIRRMWATARKHLPDVDVARVGGWSDTRTLKRAYQQADVDTMLRVVTEGGEVRETA